ncbi:hypothetical protein E2562_021350 [Oryza meyeriana var. granulata]|uniref:DUF834 domain-containing protein n=1 Tax=Oryza meyeriana var. granulata TaxID=110450 RepID=A0A6G1CHW6_9ORYZ|nr:hypothetical protein E2562_021350 [Oryza meyeriana var. granulata]
MATSAARRYRRRHHGGVDGRPETAGKRQEPEERRGEAGLRFEVDGGRSGAHRRWGSKVTTPATSSKRWGGVDAGDDKAEWGTARRPAEKMEATGQPFLMLTGDGRRRRPRLGSIASTAALGTPVGDGGDWAR